MRPNPASITWLLVSGLSLLAGCSDRRNATDGTPTALAKYDVASRGIESGKAVLGGAYSKLASARSVADFDAHTEFLTLEQLESVQAIERDIGTLISVIQSEPTTRAGALSDSVVQENQGFLIGLPRLQQDWVVARQRVSRH